MPGGFSLRPPGVPHKAVGSSGPGLGREQPVRWPQLILDAQLAHRPVARCGDEVAS